MSKVQYLLAVDTREAAEDVMNCANGQLSYMCGDCVICDSIEELKKTERWSNPNQQDRVIWLVKDGVLMWSIGR